MRITLLMPVYNGAAFLPDQLRSLACQSHLPDRLIVSDDGSRDSSNRIIANFQRHAPFRVDIIQGPGRGYAANVFALLTQAPETALGFCDQDDAWLGNRLHRGIQALQSTPGPAMQITRRISVDAKLRHPRLAPIPVMPTFRTALMQNQAPANATLLNVAAAQLLCRLVARLPTAPHFPDWWAYALLTGADSKIIFDQEAGLLYRQHRRNLLGSCESVRGRIRRARMLIDGSYRRCVRQHLDALELTASALTPSARLELRKVLTQIRSSQGGPHLPVAQRILGYSRIASRGAPSIDHI